MDQWNLQQALIFLVVHSKGEDMIKPMVAHAIRVGQLLESWDATEDTIVSGYLHDILEDTAVTYDDIDEAFGVYVAEIVEANTITNKECVSRRPMQQMFKRIVRCGSDAVMVKAADLCDNWMHYSEYHLEEKWQDEKDGLERKKSDFLGICAEFVERKFYQKVKELS